jgi:hypothetical protein
MAQFQNTRNKRVAMPAQTGASGAIRSWVLDSAGILGGIYLDIRGTITGTISAPNALGFASIIRQVRVRLSTGVDLMIFTGPGYHYIIRDFINEYGDPVSYSNARSAVTAAAYDVSMYIPIAINDRDMPGLILLQNKETTVMLTVEEEVDATVATGITGGWPVITPYLDYFTVPVNKDDRPPLNLVHSWIEESKAVSGAGDVEYIWPRGNTICSMHHGIGMAVAGADTWSRAVVRAQQNDVVFEDTPHLQDMVYNKSHHRVRPLGTISFDMLGSSGLGSYGSARDVMITQNLTSIKSVVTATGASTLYSIRRELVAVREPDAVAA